MRILWITIDVFDVFFPYVKGKPTKGKSWIAPLFNSIFQQEDVVMGAITPVIDGEAQKQVIDNVVYYSLHIDRKENRRFMNHTTVRGYLDAINDFRPDIIHVHGIEVNFGLLRKYVHEDVPMVCSVQGIISPWLSFMRQSVADTDVRRYRSLKNRMGRGGVAHALKIGKKFTSVEKEIFRLNRYFIGRTLWDKAYVTLNNPDATYYHGEELLRPPFYTTRWDIRTCEKHRVFISSSAYALKGFHLLIKAAGILKYKYPDMKIVAPLSSIRANTSKCSDLIISEDYDNYLKKEISRYGLQKNVILRKNLNAEEMAGEYKKAHLFVLPSFLENSPNSLGEAMMIGTPSIVAPVGGVLSIVKDESSTLYFPSGDYVMMAYQIDRMLSDDRLAINISKNARLIAEERHNAENITDQYMKIYRDIINKHHSLR